MSLPSLVTVNDSVWLKTSLKNLADHQIQVTIKGPPIVQLVPALGTTQVCDLSLVDAPFRQWSYNRTPNPGEEFYSFEVDLRQCFGPLNSGEYKIQFEWPPDRYQIVGVSDGGPLRLTSPVKDLKLIESSVEAASSHYPVKYRLISRREGQQASCEKPVSLGQLTNTLDRDIHFPFLPPQGTTGAEAFKAPLNVPLRLLRWYGTGAADASLPDPYTAVPDTQGLPRYKLSPGESVEIQLPDWKVKGDGIYLYQLRLDAHNGVFRNAQSQPFLINRVKKGGIKDGSTSVRHVS